MLFLFLSCPNIKSTNAKLLKGSIHKKAETLRQKEYAVALVNRGWMETFPITDEELEQLAEENDDSQNAAIINEDVTESVEDQIQQFKEQHLRIVKEARKDCRIACPRLLIRFVCQDNDSFQ